MAQTAVSWLKQIVKEMINNGGDADLHAVLWHIEQAKAMEKEQIMKAVDRGFDEGCKFPEDMTLKNAEQYYNETYKNGL
jgi:hypothetical protein